MSRYDNNEKDYMYDLVKEFIETHCVQELLQIIVDYLKNRR